MATEEPFGMDSMLRELVRQDLGLSQNIPTNLRNLVRQDLQQQGYEIVGELPTREEFEVGKITKEKEQAERLAAMQKGVGEYIEEPSFWQNLKDVATKVAKGQVDPFGLVASGLIKGITFGNIDPPMIIEKISGKKGFAEAARNLENELVPQEIARLIETPAEIAGTLLPLSAIFRGAAIPARVLTKVPFLKAVATGAFSGVATGLLRKPEREGALNRLKQVPGDVLFFSALSGAIVTVQQMARIANYNRAAKFYKKVNWEAPQVPPDGKPFTAKQMKDLFRKMEMNSGSSIAGKPLTAEEKEILDTIAKEQGWGEALKRGWIKPRAEWMTTGEPGLMPRAPKLKDIFRDPSKLPLVERPLVEVPPEEVPPRPAPPTEAPLPAEAPPLGVAPAPEVPPTPEAVPAKVPPAAIRVNLTPTAEGGWTIDLPQPPIKPPAGWVQPGATIPWRRPEPDLLLPHEEPAKRPKAKKPPKFKEPLYEAINLQGGVAPNVDYPHNELKQLFPIGLIKKTGMEMDVLAQALSHEFPTIEGDVDLWEMADNVKRGKAVFKDERTGETYPPKEVVEREAEEFVDREAERIKAEKVPRVAEEPPVIAKEPTFTEIEKVFEEMAIPRIKRGVLADQIIRNYKPEISPLKTYIKSILPKITEEGELRVKPTLKRKRVERLTPEMEEVVPGRAERPEDIFERAEEEARVQKIFKQSAKTDRERDVLDRKILKGQSYDDIGKAHGITRQRAEQLFKESFEKVKGHPDVIKMIERKMRQANLGPLPSKRDLDDAKKFIKKYFWSTRGVDKVVDEVNDKRLSNILAEIFDATPEAKVVRKFLDEYKNPALDVMVLDAIKGEIPVAGSALPSNIIDAVSTMRERMDRLSQLIMAHGALTEESKAGFESFMGKYIGKFYRLHNQRRWDPPKEVKDRFKAMLRRNYPERYGNFTEEELGNFVEGIINEERKYGFGQKKEKRVPTGHYKKRLRLSPEWRELAGEYLDPVYLYLKTVSTQSAMAYNAEFLNRVKQTYPDMWITNATEAEARGWQKYRLPDNKGYGELKNKYVHPELYNYITHEVDPVISATEKIISKFIINPFKITKTILSMPTQGRNLITNFALSLLNENLIFSPFNFHWYARATKVFLGRNKGFHEEWTKLLRENVVGVEYYGSEVPRIQSDLMRVDPLNWGEKIANIMLAGPKLAVRKLGGLYNFNDALFRIATYYKRTEKFGETSKQAVAELDRSLQNYRKLPAVVDILRRFPVFGPFISFKWNIGKIIVNQVTQATKETTSPRGSKTWWKGSKRLMRLGLFFGLPGILATAFYEAFGVDEEKVKEIEKFLPKYRKHGMFLYFRGKEGQLKAVDLTYMFPTGDWSRAYRALKAGDIESFKDAIDLFSHPLFDAWSILIEGRQPYWGTKIQGGFFKRMAEIAKLLWVPASAPLPSMKSLTESMKAGKFEPRTGALTGYQMKALIDAWNQEPDRYGRVRSLPEEVKTFFTGIKTWNVEPDRLLMQSIKAMRSEASELKYELTSWIASNTKAPAWEIKDKTDDFNKRITKLLEKAGEATELYKELKKGGFLVQKEK